MLKFGLFSVIDPMVAKLERTHPGLPGEPRLGGSRRYSTWLLVRLWLLAVLGGWSARQLLLKLADHRIRSYLSRFLSLPRRLPERSTFSRRTRQSDFLHALRLLFGHLAQRIARRRPGDLKVILLDFTDLPVNRRRDPDSTYGYTSKGRFYGYKLRLIVSRRAALLSYRLATANHHSLPLAEEMLPDVQAFCQLIRFVLGDCGYDGKFLHEGVADDLDVMLLAPANPRWQKVAPQRFDLSTARGRSLAFLATPCGRDTYRQRTVIEQVNGQLKDVFGIGRIPYYVHGEGAVERLLAARLILYNVAILKNLQRRKTHIRRLKSLVA